MLEEQIQNTIALLQHNPAIALGLGIGIAALFFFRPKDMFKLAGFCLVLIIIGYIISLLVGTVGSGIQQKDQMMYKTKQAIGE